MVKLRLKRMGSKYNAFYRIVAADERAPRDGKYIEEIGFYNPHTKEIRINEELKDKWLNEGAVPSETVKRLFYKAKQAGSKTGEVVVLPTKPKKVKKAAPKVVEAPAEEVVEAPKAEEAKEEAPAEEVVEAPKAEETKEEAPAEEVVEAPKAEEAKEEAPAEEAVEAPKAEEAETPSEEPKEDSPSEETK